MCLNSYMVLNRHKEIYFLTDTGETTTVHDNAVDV